MKNNLTMRLRWIYNSIQRYLKFWIYRIYSLCLLWYYRKTKERITFVFVLNNLSIWKTEMLYLEMKKHPRFNPILAVTNNTNIQDEERRIINYLEQQGYNYIKLDSSKTILQQIDAHIICYQRPYIECYENHCFPANRGALFVSVPYGFHSIVEKWALDELYYLRCVQEYYENDLCVGESKKNAFNKGANYVVTGTPVMDELAMPSCEFENPWKNKDSRKRIIWAPHHTIGDFHLDGIGYSTFLEVADDMLSLAQSYSDRVFWAFKPHPILYKMLCRAWGESRANEYFEKWKNLDCAQFENGKYIGLFKHSDAMIHDCASFTMEYLATEKPVMYLVREGRGTDNVNECARRSFDLHYHGHNIAEIKDFVEMVVSGSDPRQKERVEFVRRYLRAPHGKSACENIMNAILGVEEYKGLK